MNLRCDFQNHLFLDQPWTSLVRLIKQMYPKARFRYNILCECQHFQNPQENCQEWFTALTISHCPRPSYPGDIFGYQTLLGGWWCWDGWGWAGIVCYWIQWVGDRDVAKHPTKHKANPSKNYAIKKKIMLFKVSKVMRLKIPGLDKITNRLETGKRDREREPF